MLLKTFTRAMIAVSLLFELAGCASSPTVTVNSPITLASATGGNIARVQDERPEPIRKSRQDRVDGHSAQWLGDLDFSPNLSSALTASLDRAFASYPGVRLELRVANVGAFRWSDRESRTADPIVFLGGASIAANLIGNAVGQVVSDRMLGRESASREYWAVVLVVDVDGRQVVASNRRVREPNDDVQVVLSQLLQFTVDDVAFKYRLRGEK